MAGAPNPARVQVEALTAEAGITISSAGDTESSDHDILGAPFKPLRIFYRVETAVTVAASAMTLTWRPTADSASGERVVATWSQPVQAIDGVGVIDLQDSDGTTTTVGTGGLNQYGIGGSVRNEGEVEEDRIYGPGGSLEINSDGGSTAGAVQYWLEVELLSTENNQGAALTRIVPTSVGG